MRVSVLMDRLFKKTTFLQNFALNKNFKKLVYKPFYVNVVITSVVILANTECSFKQKV